MCAAAGPTTLTVFHYHLLPGGVTSVIVDGLIAVAGTGSPPASRPGRVRLVCGRGENTENVRSRLDTAGVTTDLIIEPLLDYDDESDRASVASKTREIHRWLEEALLEPDSVWWVHNYHLGKNPAFTGALVEVLGRRQEQGAILHIHDFPECGRPENLSRLAALGCDPYPLSPNVHYVVLNDRDLRYLVEAGVPDGMVTRLDNPLGAVTPPPPEGHPAVGDVRARLTRNAAAQFPSYREEGAWFLYPVRTIRRKNVLEAALLAELVEANLILTLPGTSDQEATYSAMVADGYRMGAVPGLFSVGTMLADLGLTFEDLVAAADVVVSSSVMEGFGYTYVHAAAWGKPLLARYLDILDSVVSTFRGHPVQFYEELLVPFDAPSLSDFRPYLRMRYGERLDSLPDAADRPALAEAIEDMLRSHLIDFSYLPGQMQLAILRDLADEGFRDHITAINRDTLDRARDLILERPDPRAVDVAERFGPAAFARSFAEVLGRISRTRTASDFPGAPAEGGVQRNLIRAFADLSTLRLILAQ